MKMKSLSLSLMFIGTCLIVLSAETKVQHLGAMVAVTLLFIFASNTPKP